MWQTFRPRDCKDFAIPEILRYNRNIEDYQGRKYCWKWHNNLLTTNLPSHWASQWIYLNFVLKVPNKQQVKKTMRCESRLKWRSHMAKNMQEINPNSRSSCSWGHRLNKSVGWAGQEMRPTLQSESKPTGAQPKNMHIKRKAYFGRTDQGLRELPGMLHTIRNTLVTKITDMVRCLLYNYL